jgi:hypothetical protein
MKWYASYFGPCDYTLMSEETYAKTWQENIINKEEYKNNGSAECLSSLYVFNNLKEAKDYVLFGLQGDIMEAKLSIKKIRAVKEKKPSKEN